MDNHNNEELMEFLADNFDGIRSDINGIKTDINGIQKDINGLKTDVARLESQMVTNDYLDNKMADLASDLNLKMRKEDTKVNTVKEILAEKKVIDNYDVERIDQIEVFARTN